MCPSRPNAIWAADFQFDQTANGKMLKILNVIDEFTREALAVEVDRSIDADHVVAVLDKIAGERGYPRYLRFDNGPEFVAFAVADWCRFNAATTIFIDPGSPWQNAWISYRVPVTRTREMAAQQSERSIPRSFDSYEPARRTQ